MDSDLNNIEVLSVLSVPVEVETDSEAPLRGPVEEDTESPPVSPSSRPAAPPKPSVPTYVMLPLDTVTLAGKLNHKRALTAGLRALRSVGVTGVMVDVWWGIVERETPGVYDWSAYLELAELVASFGLKLQCVMSFHACGGNVGDCCLVSLPLWVLEVASANPDMLFTDRAGVRNCEYLSFAVDELPVLGGRTPIQVYRDFMDSFVEYFGSHLGEDGIINEVSVGMGPAGELRYPAYPQGDARWKFPGIGEFQCYDKSMLSTLEACAEHVGVPEWGTGGPHDAGSYNDWPHDTGFFHPDWGSYRADYGNFFLSWYSGMMVAHGERVAHSANSAFEGLSVKLSAKLPGIHWWHDTTSRAAELTAGYYNSEGHSGYEPVMRMLARNGLSVKFTCVEMRDGEQPEAARCSPERLLEQVFKDAERLGVEVSGENALPRFDSTAHERMLHNAYRGPNMSSLTFLRMGECLFKPDNWMRFVHFTRALSVGPA